jgi:hypothetical protein
MKDKVEGILENMKKLQCTLEKEQNQCSHDNVKVEKNSNTGNYDPSDNQYWVNVECLDCGKYMIFDYEKDREQYLKYC